jgi:hypothetical protein
MAFGYLFQGQSLFRLDDEEAFEQVFAVGREKEGDPELALDDAVAQLEQRRAVEGQRAAHQHVQDNAQGPDASFLNKGKASTLR